CARRDEYSGYYYYHFDYW
nr:immunoglobulin heavy chain junction region [Macaca mulatta]MOX92697.1 immunoglobulin heavy chain junction region [Macaca mulatta]MOX93162.1 immunoglobulin heavy chain junction region [Macaca mulatta]MOX94452.1 immunoglobulin heavy chain junction region [Macaca mulatta]MOX95173.1 immunoglobulin heavy chain junction region [Macaca mulatta]